MDQRLEVARLGVEPEAIPSLYLLKLVKIGHEMASRKLRCKRERFVD